MRLRTIVVCAAMLVAVVLSGYAFGDAGPALDGGAVVLVPAVPPSAVPATPAVPIPAVLPDPAADLAGYARIVLDAVQHTRWSLLAALALVGLVYAARKWGVPRYPWLSWDPVAYALVLLGGVGGAWATALLAGQAMSWSLVLAGLTVAFQAAGSWAGLTKLLVPLWTWARGKLFPKAS